jgi:hypothetical protein
MLKVHTVELLKDVETRSYRLVSMLHAQDRMLETKQGRLPTGLTKAAFQTSHLVDSLHFVTLEQSLAIRVSPIVFIVLVNLERNLRIKWL